MKRKILTGCSLLILMPLLGLIGILSWSYISYGNMDSNTIVSMLIGSKSITVHSPDGKHYVEAEVSRRKDRIPEAYLCVLLRVYSRSGELIEEINTTASDVHQWDVEWQDEHTILMKSSDIGDQIYRLPDNK